MQVFLRLIKESILSALHEIVNNKLRAFLSLLGITIGIFCIITVFTAVDSLEINVRQSFQKLGDDVLYVEKFPWSEDPRMSWWKYLRRPAPTYEEFQALKAEVADAEGVCMMFTLSNKTAKRNQYIFESAVVNAVTYDYSHIKDLQFEQGRYFSYLETQNGSDGAILGSRIASELFPYGNAVGQQIKVLGTELTIIGVLAKEGEDIIGLSADDNIIVNYNFLKRYIDMESNLMGTRIAIKTAEGANIEYIKDEIRIVMRSTRRLNPIQKDDFAINELSLFSGILTKVFGAINFAGMFIWIFSILAGGFGIANIMFVSVKERTNLIGIKKALGAKRFYILTEFLVEAIVLCLIGGGIGLVLVYVGTIVAEYLIAVYEDMAFTFILTWQNTLIGLAISVGVGILFGFIPAYVASRMKPVDAIRSK